MTEHVHHSVTIDVTPKLYELATRVLDQLFNVEHQYHQIKGELHTIMSKIDDLQAAVAGNEASTAAGFQVIADALTELASDISAINDQIQNPPVEGITAQLQADSAAATEKFNAVAQAIKDAIPTAPVEPPPAG